MMSRWCKESLLCVTGNTRMSNFRWWALLNCKRSERTLRSSGKMSRNLLCQIQRIISNNFISKDKGKRKRYFSFSWENVITYYEFYLCFISVVIFLENTDTILQISNLQNFRCVYMFCDILRTFIMQDLFSIFGNFWLKKWLIKYK